MEEKTVRYRMRNIYFPERYIIFDDLKFVCYMIERTERRIKQPNAYVVDHLGKKGLLHIQVQAPHTPDCLLHLRSLKCIAYIGYYEI